MLARLEHVGIMVSDLDRSIRFYCGVLGFRLRGRVRLRGTTEVGFISAGDAGDAEVELVCTPGELPRDGQLSHVAFVTSDLEVDLARLKAHGVELLDPEGRLVPALNAKVAFFRGPDGEKLELFQPL